MYIYKKVESRMGTFDDIEKLQNLQVLSGSKLLNS